MTAKATLIDGCMNGPAVARLLEWLSPPDNLQAFSFVIKGLERDLIQGYLFSRPLSLTAFEEFAQQRDA